MRRAGRSCVEQGPRSSVVEMLALTQLQGGHLRTEPAGNDSDSG